MVSYVFAWTRQTLNKPLKREHYPSRTTEEVNHKFVNAKLFTKLDAKNGYWNVKLDEESSYLTTFNTPFGRYRFLWLPFGLKVSQDIFQCLMDDAYQNCRGAVNIADDVVVYGRDEKDHDRNLHEAMEKTRKSGIKLNDRPEKCQVKKESVKFYGNMYTKEGIKPDPNKVSAIKAIQPPNNKAELHTFLGIVNYMEKYVKNLADHTVSLRELLRQDVEFQWSDHHMEAFEKIKNLISEDTTLSFYDRNKPITLQVDASSRGLGATIIQDGRPIAFASKALTETESRYANIEWELLAIVYGCTKFHTILYGRSFTVESDHKPLEQVQKKRLSDAPLRLQRLLMKLQPYDFNIVYKPGKQVVLADALSRLNPEDEEEIPELNVRIHDIIDISPTKVEELQKCTADDLVLQLLQQQIIFGWQRSIKMLNVQLRPYWSMRDNLSIHDGLITMGNNGIIIPDALRTKTLSQIHAGHLGMEKSKLRAKGSVFWPGIYKDIKSLVASCSSYQENQRSQTKEPMIPMDLPPHQWHTLGSDLFLFNQSWYVIITDYYSKFPFVRKLPGLSVKHVEAFKSVLSEQGIPVNLVCDNGKQFDSAEFRSFAEQYGFKITFSSPKYPKGHGLIERHVETIKALMAKCLKDGYDVYHAILALRSTPLSHNLPSPAELLNGRIYRTNLPVRIAPSINQESVSEELRRRQNIGKEYYDLHSKALPELLPNQQVRIQDPVRKTWQPARVIEQANTPRSYIVEKQNDGGILRRNRQQIRVTGEKNSNRPVTTNNPIIPDSGGSASPRSPTPPGSPPPRPPRLNNGANGTELPGEQPGSPSPIVRTRFGRVIRKPMLFDMWIFF